MIFTKIQSYRFFSPLFFVVFIGVVFIEMLACTPMNKQQPPHQPRSTAPWEGRLQQLFDDSIDRSAVGLAGTSDAHAGGLLIQRAEEADYILRVRTAIVSTEGAGRYLITLQVMGDPIAGPRFPSKEIQISVGANSPAFGVVKVKDLRLAGTHFIAFLREFPHQASTAIHWHLARDGEDVVDAARKGAVLSELARE